MAEKPWVVVKWLDAEDFRDSTWATEEEAAAFNAIDCLVESRGWLVSKSKYYVTLAADFAPPHTWGRLIKIPRKMIKSLSPIPDTVGDT